MTRALAIAFKAQVMALVDKHKLTPEELVSVCLSLAMFRAKRAGHDRDSLHLALDAAVMKGAPEIEGAEESLAAVRAASGPWDQAEGTKLDG